MKDKAVITNENQSNRFNWDELLMNMTNRGLVINTSSDNTSLCIDQFLFEVMAGQVGDLVAPADQPSSTEWPIVVRLGFPLNVNHIDLQLSDIRGDRFSYKIQYSSEGLIWETLYDYTNYTTANQQSLYFEPIVAQQFRIRGTHQIRMDSTTKDSFNSIKSFRCYYNPKQMAVERIDGLLANPYWIRNAIQQRVYHDSNTTGQQDMKYYSRLMSSNKPIIVALDQPVMIDSFEFVLWDKDERAYSYVVEVKDGNDWIKLADKSQDVCRSLQTIAFSRRPINLNPSLMLDISCGRISGPFGPNTRRPTMLAVNEIFLRGFHSTLIVYCPLDLGFTLIAFLFSHIGLCALVFGYSIVGAFTFRAIEAPNELNYRQIITAERLHFADTVWTITQNSSVLKQKEWCEDVAKELEKLEKSLVIALKYKGYDGRDDTSDEDTLQWNFFGALLYSIIVITTIGYGNIAPKTKIGKLVTIMYAIAGIPLMLLFLSNIGDAMANSFKFLYWKVCCILCINPRKYRKRRRRKQRHVHRIAIQSLSATTGAAPVHPIPITTAPVPQYQSLPRMNSKYMANRQSHNRSNSERDLSSVPIICNKYAFQVNEISVNHVGDPTLVDIFDRYGDRPVAPFQNSIGLMPLAGGQSGVGDETDDYLSDESAESESEMGDIPNVPITLCVALVVGYICGGGFLFQFLEMWTFLDASYFSFVTLTTIGFGDLVPGSAVFSREDAQTILGICALYLLFGMSLLAMSFNLVKEEVTKKIRFIGKRIGILAKHDDSDSDSD
ncbi:unnamed protein product [Medioppia subpectinata]|uniref:Uncharacterized protein n=1 Tax=Medioppia subpectinata TaxID=1979941 RepID=A0A7R9Q0Z5_9ACAR|nr:unnamed protein product [Medioppia subpectinata]CAG2108632.1 unnamed protein product [Medioppia subpectinata]